jgi:hypothetical protein
VAVERLGPLARGRKSHLRPAILLRQARIISTSCFSFVLLLFSPLVQDLPA